MAIQTIDIEAILKKVEEDIRRNRVPRTDLVVAQYFWGQTKDYDLRDLPPEKRVSESQHLVEYAFGLYSRGFVSFTSVKDVPTREQLDKKHEYTQWLEKQYAKAHGNPCSRAEAAALKLIVGDFISIYKVQHGVDKLKDFERQGNVIKWERVFDGPITVGKIGNFWENIIKVSKKPA
jgi:hypothetical protein